MAIWPYHFTYMKTTMDINDKLLMATNAAAVRRCTTLKAIVEHALRREVQFERDMNASSEQCFEINANGLPQLKRKDDEKVTSEMVYQIMEEEGV